VSFIGRKGVKITSIGIINILADLLHIASLNHLLTSP
jgi:hypothetical protein